MLKFGRNYRLKIRIGKAVETSDGKMSREWLEEFEIKYPLTVNFTITRAQWTTMNSAHFEIYNLNDKTCAKLYRDIYDQTKIIRVEFYAGYGDENIVTLPLCFAGEVYEGYSYREGRGTEVKTELTCLTGFFSRNFCFTNRVFEAGTPPLEIIQTLCNDAGIQLGNPESSVIAELKPFDRKLKIVKNSLEALNILVGGHAHIDSAQDNDKVWILGQNDVRENHYYILNASELLETPKRRETCIEINTIFEPRIVEAQAIQIQSNIAGYFNGLYKVVGFNHTGTISGAVSGTCATKALLYTNGESFNFVSLNKEKAS